MLLQTLSRNVLVLTAFFSPDGGNVHGMVPDDDER